jgi:hypothetical protein
VSQQGKRIPTWVSGVVVLGAFAAILWAETRNPLRQQKHHKIRRDVRNLAIAAMSAVTLQALERPVVDPLTREVERYRWGLLKQVKLPGLVETALAIVLMDYTLYLWHVLTHHVPALWRFHQVASLRPRYGCLDGAALPFCRDGDLGALPGGAGCRAGCSSTASLDLADIPVRFDSLPPLQPAPSVVT